MSECFPCPSCVHCSHEHERPSDQISFCLRCGCVLSFDGPTDADIHQVGDIHSDPRSH